MIDCRWIASLFLLCVATSCHRPEPKTPLTQFCDNIMTIDYHITIGDPLTKKQTREVQQVIHSVFREVDAIYNKWNQHSELSHLNTLPAYTPFRLSPELHAFLNRTDALVKLSDGRFDPTIEPIQQLWKKKLELGKIPSPEEIDALKPCIGWRTLHINDGLFYKEDSRTQLDFGGIAKGYCVDLLVEKLHQLGLDNLYVEWGGEIRTLGFHPSRRPWRVFISRLANPNPSKAIAEVNLIDRALATSGDYFQFWKVIDQNGKETIYSHIFNPITLTPLEVKPGSVASASLLALDCMTADALAKVLMLFHSTEEAQAWLSAKQEECPDLACWIVTRSS
ncbi:MAG: FAD:protein FMN transferase [Parachlamydiaceae bacterium]